MPEISVIVPVYRAESFLRKCTDSILNQTFQDLELLLIDDGSPDHSGALCDQIAKEDPRVRVFHKDNGGVSSARNLGMTQANGQYFAFADSDDWLPPVDLMIRTSGEERLSNFLLWQCAYSEFYFTPVLFPDFTKECFDKALEEYARRDRRMGGNTKK